MIKCWRIELKFAEGDGKSVSNNLIINVQSAQSYLITIHAVPSKPVMQSCDIKSSPSYE